jgi:hypothetical protein
MSGLNWISYRSGASLNVGSYSQNQIGLNTLYNNAIDFFISPQSQISSGKITQWFSADSYGSNNPPFSTFSLDANPATHVNLAIQFSGYFCPNQTGNWTIRLGGLLNNTRCDDLGILFLGEPDTTISPVKTLNIASIYESNIPSSTIPIISNDYYYGTTNSKTIPLQAGKVYPILIYYNQGGGGYTFGLGFSFNGGSLITDFASITSTSIPSIPCFNKYTKILTNNGYIPIQFLKKGDLVKTLKHYFVPIHSIGFSEMDHRSQPEKIKNQLYKCSSDKYPEIFEDLIITGCHSILVNDFISDEQKKNAIKVNNGDIYVTDGRFRLPACVDDRTSVYEKPGNYTIYHLALENEDIYMNYGVYANGLLVESCSIQYLKELSGMTLIE